MKNNSIQAAINQVKNKNFILYSNDVLKLHDAGNGKGDNRIILITDSSVLYFKDAKVPKLSRSFYWIHFSNIQYIENKNQINLFFKEPNNKALQPCRFVDPDSKNVMKKIAVFLAIYLPKQEFEKLGIDEFLTIPIKSRAVTSLSRFRSFVHSRNMQVKQEAFVEYQNMMFNRLPILSIPKTPLIKTISEPVLYSLAVCSHFKTLLFPNNPEFDSFGQLYQVYQHKFYIPHIIFDSPLNASFEKLFTEIPKWTDFNTKSFTFSRSNFNDKQLKILLNAAVQKPFVSLSFSDAIPDKVRGFFYNEFLCQDLLSKIKYIGLDYSTGLDLINILPRFTNLRSISISNCEFDLSLFLSVFSTNKFPYIEQLNLSYNTAHGSLDDYSEFKFPKTLRVLDITGVDWNENTLESFIKILSHSEWDNGIELRMGKIRNADISNSACEFLKLHPIKNLVSLSWSSNSFTRGLLDFLSTCNKLSTLYFNNCFSSNNISLLADFCRTILTIASLTQLYIRGNQQNQIGGQASVLFETIGSHPNLKTLDVSGNVIGADCFNSISDMLIRNHSIINISFDDSGIETHQPIQDLVSSLESRPTALYISWPIHTMSELLGKEKVDKKVLQQLKTNMIKLYRENDLADDHPMKIPFDMVILDDSDYFPKFYSEDQNDSPQNSNETDESYYDEEESKEQSNEDLTHQNNKPSDVKKVIPPKAKVISSSDESDHDIKNNDKSNINPKANFKPQMVPNQQYSSDSEPKPVPAKPFTANLSDSSDSELNLPNQKKATNFGAFKPPQPAFFDSDDEQPKQILPDNSVPMNPYEAVISSESTKPAIPVSKPILEDDSTSSDEAIVIPKPAKFSSSESDVDMPKEPIKKSNQKVISLSSNDEDELSQHKLPSNKEAPIAGSNKQIQSIPQKIPNKQPIPQFQLSDSDEEVDVSIQNQVKKQSIPKFQLSDSDDNPVDLPKPSNTNAQKVTTKPQSISNDKQIPPKLPVKETIPKFNISESDEDLEVAPIPVKAIPSPAKKQTLENSESDGEFDISRIPPKPKSKQPVPQFQLTDSDDEFNIPPANPKAPVKPLPKPAEVKKPPKQIDPKSSSTPTFSNSDNAEKPAPIPKNRPNKWVYPTKSVSKFDSSKSCDRLKNEFSFSSLANSIINEK